jgi:hypothetical protein
MALEEWFNSNMSALTVFVFSAGFVKHAEFWADTLYIGSDRRFLPINRLAASSASMPIWLRESGRFPGSTIQLPWGFLQPHRPGRTSGPYQLQFHHDARLLEI